MCRTTQNPEIPRFPKRLFVSFSLKCEVPTPINASCSRPLYVLSSIIAVDLFSFRYLACKLLRVTRVLLRLRLSGETVTTAARLSHTRPPAAPVLYTII